MKIYIINPWHVSGGPEIIHQLCSKINDLGVECSLVYTFCDIGNYVPKKSDENKFIPEYSHYNLRRSFVIDDDPKNVIIIPECYHPSIIHQVQHMKIIYWWLSIENPKYSWNLDDPIFKTIFHGCHSEKSINILSKKINMEKIIPLHDHVNDLFIKSEDELMFSLKQREKIVLFNPKKQPNEITKTLEKMVTEIDSSIRFIPIENMSLKEVSLIANKSKLYIDFGFHPGRERLPREMVISGCSVITGDEGVSSCYEDVPLIKRKFKRPYDYEKISQFILQEVNNHSSSFFDEELKNYRNIVRNDKQEFEDNAKKLLEKMNQDID